MPRFSNRLREPTSAPFAFALTPKNLAPSHSHPLVNGEELPVDEREEDVGRLEEGQLPVDELVERPLPLEQEPREAASR